MKHILEKKVLFYGVIVRTFWMTLVFEPWYDKANTKWMWAKRRQVSLCISLVWSVIAMHSVVN